MSKIGFCCETVLRVYVDAHKVAEWPITDETVKEDMKEIVKNAIYRFFNPSVGEILWINNNKDGFKEILNEMSEKLWNNIIRHISYYNNIINKGERI